MKLIFVFLIVTCFTSTLQVYFSSSPRRPGFGPGEQDWGWYRNLNKGFFTFPRNKDLILNKTLHIFYWLFYTQANDVDSPFEKPLVIWLGPEPGISSTGYGNFEEVGPLFANGTKRPLSWVNYVNLLFIDYPGTGYSYFEISKSGYSDWYPYPDALPKNHEEIGEDMVKFLIEFYKNHPEFRTVPLYIFGEGYGGRMAVEFATQLDAAITKNELNANFGGVGLGDPWISLGDSFQSWAPLLLHHGLVDQEEHDEIARKARRLQKAVKDKGYLEPLTYEFKDLHDSVGYIYYKKTLYFNMRKNEHVKRGFLTKYLDSGVPRLMQHDVRNALHIYGLNYYYENDDVMDNLKSEMLKPVISKVEELLKNPNLKVAVYNSELDLWTPINGTLQWIDRLHWSGASEWEFAEDKPIMANGMSLGYEKTLNNLYFYAINDAGLSVPKDNPEAAVEVLRRITNFDKNRNNGNEQEKGPIDLNDFQYFV